MAAVRGALEDPDQYFGEIGEIGTARSGTGFVL